uniref:Uncharacterized protein n=1 Tax=Anguilla anguilla TaxID=7936 RepID=A0A0E9WYL8_ANGAN
MLPPPLKVPFHFYVRLKAVNLQLVVSDGCHYFLVLVTSAQHSTCIYEDNRGVQQCTLGHSRTVGRVLYTRMSSTELRRHQLQQLISA